MVSPTGEVQRIADTLVSRILDGSYPSGLRLPAEAALAEELSCGRSTIREALRYLADLGLIRSRRGSGAMVLDYRREGTPALLSAYVRRGALDGSPVAIAEEMLRLRTLMACEAVRLAARHATDDKLERARACLRRGPELESDPAAHTLNELELYRELVLASGMWPAAWLVNAFWGPLRDLNALFAPAMGPVKPTFQATMIQLFDNIEAHDEEGSVALIRAWFETVDAELIRILSVALDPQGAPPPTNNRDKP